MNAQKMFEKLGYKKLETFYLDTLVDYAIGNENEEELRHITFYDDYLEIDNSYLSYDLFKAINEQIKEIENKNKKIPKITLEKMGYTKVKPTQGNILEYAIVTDDYWNSYRIRFFDSFIAIYHPDISYELIKAINEKNDEITKAGLLEKVDD